jgi:hypothetical protein
MAVGWAVLVTCTLLALPTVVAPGTTVASITYLAGLTLVVAGLLRGARLARREDDVSEDDRRGDDGCEQDRVEARLVEAGRNEDGAALVQDVEALLRAADSPMYLAKHRGGGVHSVT